MRNACRDRARQPSDDVIFVGDDVSHERRGGGAMFGFNGARGGGGAAHKNTVRVPSYCAGQVSGEEGRGGEV